MHRYGNLTINSSQNSVNSVETNNCVGLTSSIKFLNFDSDIGVMMSFDESYNDDVLMTRQRPNELGNVSHNALYSASDSRTTHYGQIKSVSSYAIISV